MKYRSFQKSLNPKKENDKSKTKNNGGDSQMC